MEEKAHELFQDAVKKLNEAKNELFRPEEDVVRYMVCKNSQFAVENFLKGLLFQNGVDPSSFTTINELYEQCKAINKNFDRVDLSDFDCKLSKLNSSSCNELSKVESCFDAANDLDTFLRQEKII